MALGRWTAMPAKDETTIWQNDNDETTQKKKIQKSVANFRSQLGV